MRYVIGDTETTGLPPSYQCCEIAWMLIDEDFNILDHDESLIDPGIPIPPEVTKINGITDAMVADKPTLEEYKQYILKDRLAGDICLIAHQASFDLPFFKRICDVKATICTVELARLRLGAAVPNHKLQTLRELYGISLEGDAHRAMADIKVLRHMAMDLIGAKGFEDYLNQPPQLLSVMPFGKHKGMAMIDIPRAYAAWAIKQDSMDRHVIHTFKTLFDLE